MSPRAGWLLVNEIVPRFRSAIPQVAHCAGAEDTEKLIQDATLHAARILHSAEARGKKITAGNACFYAIQHTRNGRRSTGNSCVDVHATGTQLHGHSRLHSLEEVVATNEETGGEIFELHDVLSNDQENPGTRAARKMDWESFMAGLSQRDQAIVCFMIEGKSVSGMARKLKVSDWTVRNKKMACKYDRCH